MGVVSAKLRDSARGQDCTLNLPGVCNWDPETVVLAHLPSVVKGMMTKSDDWHACFACSDCHTAIDNPKGNLPYGYMLRALQRTQKVWFEMGMLRVPVSEKRRPALTKIYPRKTA